MSRIYRYFILVISFSAISFFCVGQNKVFSLSGFVDCSIYSWYRNPTYIDNYGKSSGSLFYNFGTGLGFTLGAESVGVAAYGRGMFNIFNFDFRENKGFSALNYGVIGSLYIGHPHSWNKFCLMLGGAFQWNRTELWLKPRPYRSLKRSVFETQNIQLVLRFPPMQESWFLRFGKGVDGAITFEGGLIIFGKLARP